MDKVEKIIKDVERKGDRALIKYTSRYDNARLSASELEVPADELDTGARQVEEPLASALKRAAENIKSYAAFELNNLNETEYSRGGFDITGRLIPVERAGIYVPGGRYSYPSTVLMCSIPAREAGVDEVVMVSPPGNITPAVCLAAKLSGVSRVFRVGGAQGIAALAFGTDTIPAVDMIAGPGNSYVQRAKMILHGRGVVGVDMLAGPSEVVLIADSGQNPEVICADLAAQAEHAPDAKSCLITWDGGLLEKVESMLDSGLKGRVSLIKVKDSSEAVNRVNRIAPEHLQLACGTEIITGIVGKVRNAGAVFLGRFSPVALGDYWAGPSHTLPTGGTARYGEGLSVRSFMKNVAFITASREGLEYASGDIARLAREEGMENHALSVEKRFRER